MKIYWSNAGLRFEPHTANEWQTLTKLSEALKELGAPVTLPEPWGNATNVPSAQDLGLWPAPTTLEG